MIKNPQNDIDYLSVSATMRNKKGEKLIIMIIIIASTAAATTHLTEMQYGLTLKTDSISHLLPLVFASLSKVILTSLHVLQGFLKRCCAVLRVPWWSKETSKQTNFRVG